MSIELTTWTVHIEDVGPHVAHAQDLLNRWLAVSNREEIAPLTVDGIAGPATHDRIFMFQNAHSLYADGAIGQRSWPVLARYGPPVPVPLPLDIMVIVDTPNLSRFEAQKIVDANNAAAELFAVDHQPFTVTLGSADRFDPDLWVPHVWGSGDNGVPGAAGYHTITANGGDIEAWMYSNADLAQFDITVAHEHFEAAANRTTNKWADLFGEPGRMAAYEVCDPVSDRWHLIRGVRVAAWVTDAYFGDNKEPAGYYDSGRLFGESPIVDGPKRRTAGGFQIVYNLDARQIEYRWGDSQAGEAWTNTVLPEHVGRRVARCDVHAAEQRPEYGFGSAADIKGAPQWH